MSLGAYVHLPFCHTHCTYCPFAISTDLALQDAYTAALLREIENVTRASARGLGNVARASARGLGGLKSAPHFDTLYFGGGTPSRTAIDNLRRIVAAFAIEEGAEVTLEANPEDVTEEAVQAWRELGVNRISVGVQSFNDDELQAIGRVHDRARAIEAVRLIANSGARANLDLILGLPRQTAESYRASLDTAVQFGAGHLSLYMLDLEERTPLQVQASRGRVTLPDEDVVADLYLETVDRLGAAGLQQYEISNFARPGEESRHNLRYWRRSEYLGFGMGAHSFVGARRFANTRDIRRYIELAPDARDFEETLTDEETRHELLFLQLRQALGMCYEDLVASCGKEGIAWIERGLQDGWLVRKGERVAFTPRGFLQSNDFISQLF
ncbi:MAG TPA: radical SAM family heme chaperone HemW [Thermoanaerobaculia bacterium]|jgi:oxygen-independent coproporphyrinogen-3 oxidase|nr:radical SAM family heme chaperone HemW [Thermoanaerobaculia bacterium]